MTKIKKAVVALALVFTLLWSFMTVLANQPTNATYTKDGVESQLLIDKTEYNKGDKIEVGLRVRNTNPYDVKNVKAELVLPGGIAATGATTLQRDLLLAGADMGTLFQLHKSTNPLTGEGFTLLLNMIMILMATVLLIYCVRSKKLRKKSIALLLCFALVFPGFSPFTVGASELSDHSYTLGCTFKMENATYEVKAKITYGDLLDEGSQTDLGHTLHRKFWIKPCSLGLGIFHGCQCGFQKCRAR